MRVIEYRRKGGMGGGIGFRITDAQRAELDRLAAERRCGISELAREALDDYLEGWATTRSERCGATSK